MAITTTGYIQARHHYSGREKNRMIVCHCMQAPMSGGRAKRTATYFADTDRKASTQFCIDNREVWQCLQLDSQCPYGAGYGSNRDGQHIEFSGYAEYSREQWLSTYGVDQLKIGARLINELCAMYGVPKVLLKKEDLLAGRRDGVTMHWWLSQAVGKGHWDLGYHFPFDVLFKFMEAPYEMPAFEFKTQCRSGCPDTNHGDTHRIQMMLNGLPDPKFHAGPADGIFGEQTERGVKAWQAYLGIEADGIWGPDTGTKTIEWSTLMRWLGAEGLKKGDCGPAVVELGHQLNKLGAGIEATECVHDGHIGAIQTLNRFWNWDPDAIQGVITPSIEEGIDWLVDRLPA